MKQIALFTFSLLMSFTVSAQNVIDDHFQYLVEDKNSTNINVTGKMFQLINSIDMDVEGDDQELAEMKEFIGSITGFQMVVGKELPAARSQFDQGLQVISRDYEELLSVDDKEGQFRLYVDESRDVVREVVGIGTAEEGLMVFSFVGDMRLDQVGKVIKHIQDSDFNKGVDLKDMDPDKVAVYPNPVNKSSRLQLEIPSAMQGGAAKLYDGQGNLINTYQLDNLTQSIDMSATSAGSYVLKVEKEGVTVTKKVLVID